MSDFEPKIIAFLCNWCSYAGADLAGISRNQYPTNIRILRVMCSGRLDPRMIFKSFRAGADGVLVTGCHPGDCHYISGNRHTELRITALERMLAKIGLEPERLRLEWVSASEGEKFASVVSEFTEGVRTVGPLSDSQVTPDAFRGAEIAFAGSRLRILLGRELELTENENAYGDIIDRKEYDDIVADAVDREFERGMILHLLDKENSSVLQLSSDSGIPSTEVLRHIVLLRGKGLVTLADLDERTPIYGLGGGVVLD